MSFSNRFLCEFTFQNRTLNLEFSLKSIGKTVVFWLSDCFNIKSLLDTILVPTWLDVGTPKLHFGYQNPSKSCLGSVLGVILAVLATLEGLWERLRLVLGSSWAVLKASWTVLEGSWGVLEAS